MVLRLPIWQPSSLKIKSLLNICAFILTACPVRWVSCRRPSSTGRGGKALPGPVPPAVTGRSAGDSETGSLPFLGPSSVPPHKRPSSHLPSCVKS